MIRLRRVYNPNATGFEISIDQTNPMGMIINEGIITEVVNNVTTTMVFTATTLIQFPVSDVAQNVEILLYPREIEPLVINTYADGTHQVMPPCLLMLAHFTIPPGCVDLRTLDIYLYSFVNDKDYETPFVKGEVVWEIL